MFENQYVVLVNVRKPFFCYVFAFFPEYVPPRQFLWGARGWFPRMEGHTRVQKRQLYCGTSTQVCALFQSKRMTVVVDIWRCLVWSMPMLLAMRALDLVSGPSCHWQWTGSIFFFSGDFLWGVAWWRLLSWISNADRWYHPGEMWAGNAIVRVRIESLNRSTLDFHLGTTGITLSCQPQNWLLVANPEVGNSEYIHYSELPTPLIIIYLV